MKRKEIALVHPKVNIGGGSEAVLFWIIQALYDQYDLSIITSNQFNIDQGNRFYNTNINPNKVKIVALNPPRLFKNSNKFNAISGYRLEKFCKKNSNRYDLMFSTYNPIDFGIKGIQYVLDPNFNENLLRLLNPYPKKLIRWFYKDTIFRKIYLSIGKLLSGYREEGMKQNYTIVDSNWAGELTTKTLGISTKTLYPPMSGNFVKQRWIDRANRFICMGRIVPDKEIDKIIQILKIIRDRGWDIHLHIIGKVVDRSYFEKLQKKVKRYRSWIAIEGAINSKKKYSLLASNKFGIHGKSNEPFGIAVAEMVKAGMIVWVPKGGGQVEIIDHPLLIYHGIEDAVEKIERLLNDDSLQQEVLEHLTEQANKYSAEQFKEEVRLLVRDFFNGKI